MPSSSLDPTPAQIARGIQEADHQSEAVKHMSNQATTLRSIYTNLTVLRVELLTNPSMSDDVYATLEHRLDRAADAIHNDAASVPIYGVQTFDAEMGAARQARSGLRDAAAAGQSAVAAFRTALKPPDAQPEHAGASPLGESVLEETQVKQQQKKNKTKKTEAHEAARADLEAMQAELGRVDVPLGILQRRLRGWQCVLYLRHCRRGHEEWAWFEDEQNPIPLALESRRPGRRSRQ